MKQSNPSAGDTLPSPSKPEQVDAGNTTVPGAAKDSPFLEPGPLTPGAAVHRYVILHPLGKGGMGVVYAAFDPQLDRKVAIKILRPDRSNEVFKQRLLREAQAMARVAHPNVLRVFDAGVLDDLVFLAMEFVDGETLDEWMARTKPTWQEALRVFVEAGRGLAAAHAAGLVHRDFKPANVLIGADKSVRVTDFGLARADDANATPEEHSEPQGSTSGPTPLSAQLTQAGAFLGTPGYMAPEQMDGRSADARADQFAFCVAAYEAIYGDRPYQADTLQQLSAAIAAGSVSTPTRVARVPSWVRKALLRGLRADANQRWPSMDALLAQINTDPGATLRRRLLVIAAVEALAVVTLSWRTVVGRSGVACRESDGALNAVWSPANREQIHSAFSATGAVFAEDAWNSVEARLGGYAAEWRAMRRDACEATRVHGTQSAELMDLRMQCLDRRLDELSALTGLLSKADVKVVQGAVSAAHSLTSLQGCADAAALRGVVHAPSDAESLRTIAQVRATITHAKELQEAGHFKEALPVAEAAAQQGRATNYAPLVAESLVRLGEVQTKSGDRKAAEATLQDAVYFGEVGHHDEMAARAWSQLAMLTGYEGSRHTEGETFARYAGAAIQRLGGNAELEADERRALGLVLQNEGRFDEALIELRESLALREKKFGPAHPQVAIGWTSVGNTYILKSDFQKAREAHERALAIRLKLLGPNHPDTAVSYHNLGITSAQLGNLPEAVQFQEKALAIDEATTGPHGDHAANDVLSLAKEWLEMKDLDKAEPLGRRAVEDLARLFGPDSSNLAPAMLTLGRIKLARKEPDKARAYLQRGLDIRQKQMGPTHVFLFEFLVYLAECDLATHGARNAIALLDRASTLSQIETLPADSRAEADWARGRAFWDAGRDRKRAIQLVQGARDAFRRQSGSSDEAKEATSWLASHRE